MDYSVKHNICNLIEGDYFSLFSSRGMAELAVQKHQACVQQQNDLQESQPRD
jgi:hypothetical protein